MEHQSYRYYDRIKGQGAFCLAPCNTEMHISGNAFIETGAYKSLFCFLSHIYGFYNSSFL